MNTEQRIKDNLKNVVPEDVYYRWIDKFIFEKIDENEIIIAYTGTDSLKEFKKDYKDVVWVNTCAVVGYVKKIKYYKKATKESAPEHPEAEIPVIMPDTSNSVITKKNLKLTKAFAMSAIFVMIALVIAVIGVNYIGNRNFKEVFYSVSSLKVDSKIRVIQITDLHNSLYGKNNSKLISRVDKLNPDLILLTGDTLDSGAKSTDMVVDMCSQLSKVAPTYYIYGNNEVERFYDVALNKDELDKKFGFNDENRKPEKLIEVKDDFEEELEKNGVKVLKNEMDTISVGNKKVDVYGVLTSNPSSFWPYAGESFGEYLYNNSNNLKITAIHEPFIFEEFEEDTWGDLIIAGHTHGGVIRIPKMGPLFTREGGILPERSDHFVYGRYDVAGTPIIVGSGLTNKNVLRINNEPELVIVDITRF